MNRSQAKELFTLITTVRHVDETDVTNPPARTPPIGSVCLLAEAVRHGVYDFEDVQDPRGGSSATVFPDLFGCTEEEADDVICMGDGLSTGENHYQAGKKLIEKYGYGDLFETTLSFSALMDELKQPVSVA